MKKYLLLFRDIFERYIPVVSFMVMFFTFILQVFFRYVIHHPLTWTQEVIVISFVWTVIFGACYTMRQRSHVKFTMIYDRLPPRWAALVRLLGNMLIAVLFLWLVPSSWRYSFFTGFQKTAVFRIPLTPYFLPFVYFLVSIVGYTLPDIFEDLKVLGGKIPDSRDHKAAEPLNPRHEEAAK
jgi:TRAP-type C4-dicarboxylate transport system permease small subunit